MSLTREECEKQLSILKNQYEYLNCNFRSNYPYTIEMVNGVYECFDRLIEEHFDLAKENERLQSQLLECQRVCKQKQDKIEELLDAVKTVESVLEETNSNPPLEFEELKEGLWVWDNKNKLYIQIDEDFDEGNGNIILRFHEDSYNSDCERVRFEENRFYRKQVDSILTQKMKE